MIPKNKNRNKNFFTKIKELGMKELSAKFDIVFNWLRCIYIIFCFFIVTLIFVKPLTVLNAKEVESFNSNLKNYNVKLQILNKDKKQMAEFTTAIADDDNKRKVGLMNLNSMPQNNAMLFVFEESQVIVMWMKNTLIPLDMLFIDKNSIITKIAANTTPFSLAMISSENSVNRVLEINAGLSEKLGIKVGQEVKLRTILNK